jgi:hypothetical protein
MALVSFGMAAQRKRILNDKIDKLILDSDSDLQISEDEIVPDVTVMKMRQTQTTDSGPTTDHLDLVHLYSTGLQGVQLR